MVVKTRVVETSKPAGKAKTADPAAMDLAYLALFVGMRVNEMVGEGMKARGFTDLRQSHGYVIQHLIRGEISITELAVRMDVTQQAASKVVAEMSRLGIIEYGAADDRRKRPLRLSKRGWLGVELARSLRRRIDGSLVKVLGEEQHELARQALLACLGKLGGIERIRDRRVRMPQ